ncbi:collagen alpha-1(I) chain-like [Chroicocephalus ridibundus]|uniref:collagen alpha-1(I) chain-like n=1 Tax=Chroicocephalus ridibundus TaxID=1192867 RepID=UPI002FDD1AD5
MRTGRLPGCYGNGAPAYLSLSGLGRRTGAGPGTGERGRPNDRDRGSPGNRRRKIEAGQGASSPLWPQREERHRAEFHASPLPARACMNHVPQVEDVQGPEAPPSGQDLAEGGDLEGSGPAVPREEEKSHLQLGGAGDCGLEVSPRSPPAPDRTAAPNTPPTQTNQRRHAPARPLPGPSPASLATMTPLPPLCYPRVWAGMSGQGLVALPPLCHLCGHPDGQ